MNSKSNSLVLIKILSLLLVFVTVSCKKRDCKKPQDTMVKAQIAGSNYKACPSKCCSGWFIVINGNTFVFDELPSNSALNMADLKFPVNVKVDYQVRPDICSQYIVINKIELN